MITVDGKVFSSEQEYQSYLTSLKVFQYELDNYYDEIGPGVYIRRGVPGVPEQYTFEPLAAYPTGETPGEEVPTGEATARRLSAVCTEGVKIAGGDTSLFSTGPVRPTVVNGWVNAMAAAGQDGSYASHPLTEGVYTEELVCSGFNFNIPSGASIKGIVVRVVRRKL